MNWAWEWSLKFTFFSIGTVHNSFLFPSELCRCVRCFKRLRGSPRQRGHPHVLQEELQALSRRNRYAWSIVTSRLPRALVWASLFRSTYYMRYDIMILNLRPHLVLSTTKPRSHLCVLEPTSRMSTSRFVRVFHRHFSIGACHPYSIMRAFHASRLPLCHRHGSSKTRKSKLKSGMLPSAFSGFKELTLPLMACHDQSSKSVTKENPSRSGSPSFICEL